MSKKRFDLSQDNHIRENGLIMQTEEVIDLLNSQSNAILAYEKVVYDLKKENEQLREEVKLKEQEIRSLMRYRVI